MGGDCRGFNTSLVPHGRGIRGFMYTILRMCQCHEVVRGHIAIVAMATKTVLVEFQGHSRIMAFQESENETDNATAAVEEIYSDLFSSLPSPKYSTTVGIDM